MPLLKINKLHFCAIKLPNLDLFINSLATNPDLNK